ncbi:MAG: HesA/MoeB/ThiF family protein [Candidatus Micrarchaeia archaeon]
MKIPYEELFFRNRGTLSAKEQSKLKKARVAIVGLGGTGGFALENLVRVGVENFVLFDSDRFELSNSNRQLLCSIRMIDKWKTGAAARRLKGINPNVKVRTHVQAFDSNARSKISDCDFVLDCSDNIETRLAISSACSRLRIPFVFCSASFSRGMVSVFLPNKKFGSVFHFPSDNSKATFKTAPKSCSSVICPAPAISGTLAASQAINFLIGKPFVKAPEFIFFNLFSKELLWKKRI